MLAHANGALSIFEHYGGALAMLAERPGTVGGAAVARWRVPLHRPEHRASQGLPRRCTICGRPCPSAGRGWHAFC